MSPRREILVDKLRDEALRQHAQGYTWADMSKDAGYKSQKEVPKALGIYKQATRTRGKVYDHYAKTIHPDKALRIAEVLGLDPHDIGL